MSELVVEHGKDLAPILITYIAGRMGRKITVIVDGTTNTAGSKREIEDLIPVVNDLRKKA